MTADDDLSAGGGRPRWGIRGIALWAGLVTVGLLSFWSWRVWQKGLPASLRQQAEQASFRGRWQEVENLATQWIDLDPRNGQAWMLRARAAHEQHDAARSARVLMEMPDACPEKLAALAALAELQLGSLVDPLAAEQTYRQILERDPTSKLSHQRLIFIYAITYQREALKRQARRAMELQCEPIEAFVYLFLADELPFSNRLEFNRLWLASQPSSELFNVVEAIHMATSLKAGILRDELPAVLRARKLAASKDRLLAALFERYPENLELLAWHIEQAIERGELERTVELLARLPAQADADNRFWRYAGWAQAQLGKPQDSLANYEQALQLHPLDWTTRHLLADLCREQRQVDDVERLEKVVQAGYELTLALYVVPDNRTVPESLLQRLADFAEECGDELYATSLRRRLKLADGTGERSH